MNIKLISGPHKGTSKDETMLVSIEKQEFVLKHTSKALVPIKFIKNGANHIFLADNASARLQEFAENVTTAYDRLEVAVNEFNLEKEHIGKY